ncbi:DUF58 domain-containing protein [Leptolyngbya sp. 15MV]|nr:DUF58 domain-containing protein [Leptolyngbya sp. 15MV]
MLVQEAHEVGWRQDRRQRAPVAVRVLVARAVLVQEADKVRRTQQRRRRRAVAVPARTGTLVVRQNAAPSPTRLWITLSIGQGASDQDIERAVALAASAVAAAIDDHVAVGLALPGGLVRTPRQGQSHGSRLLHDLAQWSPSMAPPPWPPSADRAARLTITAGASAQAGHGAVWRAERAAELFELSALDESGRIAAGALDLLPPPSGSAP